MYIWNFVINFSVFAFWLQYYAEGKFYSQAQVTEQIFVLKKLQKIIKL